MVTLLGLRCVRCSQVLPVPGPSEPFLDACPACGGNLAALVDTATLRRTVTRASLAHNPNPGLWRYLPFLPVEGRGGVERLQMGPSPLLRAPVLGRLVGLDRLWLKDETRNPSASLKDRATAVALAVAHERGVRIVAGASTGNASSSLACFAARLGMSAVIFVPGAAPQAKVAQLLLYGAQVVAVRGTPDDALDLCVAACRELGWYPGNTGQNPYTREGTKTCAFEMVEQLGWQVPDAVFVSAGDGNILSGLWKGFVELREAGLTDRCPRLVAVQASACDAIARAFARGGVVEPAEGETIAGGIGVRMPRDADAALAALRDSQGFAVSVGDEDILEAMKMLACTEGILAEAAAAATVAGLLRATSSGLVPSSALCVAVITGSGLKDGAALDRSSGRPSHIIEPRLDALRRLLRERLAL